MTFCSRYGVREHAMGAIMVGLAAYGKGTIIPAAGKHGDPKMSEVELKYRLTDCIGTDPGTFLNFVSYAAPAVRLAALSHLQVIWVATHDSISLGEDGPTVRQRHSSERRQH